MSRRRIALRFRAEGLDYASREILAGVKRYADAAGWRWFLDPAAGDEGSLPCEGIVSPDGRRHWKGHDLQALPVVLVSAQNRGGAGPPAVCPSHHRVGTLALAHLRERDYRSFAHAGYRYHWASAAQEKGFVRSLRRRGRGADIAVFLRGRRRWSPQQAVARRRKVLAGWLDGLRLPVGLFASDPLMGHMVATAALEKGLRIPDDLGIVVAGNDPFFCESAECPLTSIDLRLDEVGFRAARLLERLMDGDVPPTRNVTVEPRLVARRSTDRRFLDDPAVAEALAYIAGNCHRALTVPEIAEAAGMGRQQLLRRIKRVRERTVEQEIVLARLARGRDLLAEGSYSVEGVARACGFACAGSFSRAWRRYHGEPPSAARVRRPEAPLVPDPFEEAKRRLATSNDDLGMVAMLTGYRSAYRLRTDFWLREHIGPGEWRKRNRQLPEPQSRRFTITFIGPTGEIEDQEVYDIPAGPPAGVSRRGSRGGRGSREEEGGEEWMEPQMNADERGQENEAG